MVYWWRRHWLIWNWQLLPSCASSGVFFLFLSSRGGELFIIRGIKIRYLWINKYKKKNQTTHWPNSRERNKVWWHSIGPVFFAQDNRRMAVFPRRFSSDRIVDRITSSLHNFPVFSSISAPPFFQEKIPLSWTVSWVKDPPKKKKIENRLKIFPSWGRKKTFGCSLLRQHPSPERRVTMATSLMVTCCERPL